MADVTISQLSRQTPTINALIPITQDGSTYSAELSSLNKNLFYIRANCTGIATSSMPNVNSEYPTPAARPNLLPINTIETAATNSIWSSSLDSVNNRITVPYDGLYNISAKFEGFVPNSSWNIRAFGVSITVNDVGVDNFGYFNCNYSGFSNTHFCFQPFTSTYILRNSFVKIYYQIFSASGSTAACYQPIYNHSHLNIVQLT